MLVSSAFVVLRQTNPQALSSEELIARADEVIQEARDTIEQFHRIKDRKQHGTTGRRGVLLAIGSPSKNPSREVNE